VLSGKYAAEAKDRQRRHGGTAPGKKKTLPANLPEVSRGDSRDKLGKLAGVCGRTMDHARKVVEKGTPELVEAASQGRIAVSSAAVLAGEPPEVQIAEVNGPKRRRPGHPGATTRTPGRPGGRPGVRGFR
jgi:hypothetical protein